MTSLVSYETFVDECADVFAQRLQEMADTGKVVNMSHWLQCYAFDVIACITYGSRFGFLDRGDDIRGMMNDLHAVLRYSTLVGIVSWLHSWIFYPASRLQLFGARGRVATMDFVKRRMAIRDGERQLREPGDKTISQAEGVTRDFLDRLLDQHEQNPEKTTMYHVFLVGLANINAGSDTTATSLSGILYYLLKTPRALARLREEIDDFTARGQLSANPTFKETQRMPYLDAVVKEALRMHPAVGLPLWRVVPKGGVEVAGRFLPPGTNVGINAWVAVSGFSQITPRARQLLCPPWPGSRLTHASLSISTKTSGETMPNNSGQSAGSRPKPTRKPETSIGCSGWRRTTVRDRYPAPCCYLTR